MAARVATIRAMRPTVLVVLLLIAGSSAGAEPKDPYDALSYEVVVPTPKDVVYARGERVPLKLDL